MSKENNLTDFLTDVADAIREKKGTTDKINPQDFSNEIKGIKTSVWTGHVDVEGLKAIGWDDEDIAYFQEHGVNWMEEDDEYHKVSDDNKALYGVLTADNIQEYKNRIVWLPKIDFSSKTSLATQFEGMINMRGIPILDLNNITNVYSAFKDCWSLSCISLKNTSNIINVDNIFFGCKCLNNLSLGNLYKVGTSESIIYNCRSIKYLALNIKSAYLHALCCYCNSLIYIDGIIDVSKAGFNNPFIQCYCLQECRIMGLKKSISIIDSALISKQSILYMIENEAAMETITITLHASAYARLATDPDIVAALENHPNISLASA